MVKNNIKNQIIKLRVPICGTLNPQIEEIIHYIKKDKSVGIFGLKNVDDYIKRLKKLNVVCKTEKIKDTNNNIVGYLFKN